MIIIKRLTKNKSLILKEICEPSHKVSNTDIFKKRQEPLSQEQRGERSFSKPSHEQRLIGHCGNAVEGLHRQQARDLLK